MRQAVEEVAHVGARSVAGAGGVWACAAAHANAAAQAARLAVLADLAFAERGRAGAAAGWLVNVSNDAWFGDSIAPPQHLDIARMRARELARPIARATNTGITAVIDARGRVTARAAPFTVTALRGQIVPQRGLTPFARYGEAPVIVLCVALCALAWRRTRQKTTPIAG